MSSVLLLGAGAGAGFLLLLGALRRPRPPLGPVVRDLEARRPAGPSGSGYTGHLAPSAAGSAHAGRLVQRAASSSGPAAARAPDLEILGRTPEQHALRKLGAAAALAAVPPLTAGLLALGGIRVSPTGAGLLAVAFALGGWLLPDLELRGLAAERRAAFVQALSGYLDVTAVLLAGGAGTESALHAAARLDDGWPHRRLRAALERCRLTGQTPWDAFAALGAQLDVTELSQLASSLQLAGEHGARVRSTLTERARALRAHQLADAEARARAVTEQMSVPVALLAVAFMLFVGFPAVWVVLGEL